MSIFARSFQSHSSPVIQITLALYFCCWKACRSQLGLSSINKNQFLSSQENEALPNTEAVWSWSCSWLCMVLFITEVCWRLIGSIKRKQTDCLRKLVSDYNSSDTADQCVIQVHHLVCGFLSLYRARGFSLWPRSCEAVAGYWLIWEMVFQVDNKNSLND